jgi:hypothetical protein
MVCAIKRTDTFLERFEQVRNNEKVLTELNKKLAQLSEDS